MHKFLSLKYPFLVIKFTSFSVGTVVLVRIQHMGKIYNSGNYSFSTGILDAIQQKNIYIKNCY